MVEVSPREIRAIKDYIAEEVRRQGRGPDRIPGMFAAWMEAIQAQYDGVPLNNWLINRWAHLIEPQYNDEGNWWRRVDVSVGLHNPPTAREVPRLMTRFIENVEGMEALEAYKEFEFIHPFEDGNGRTGKIILNWLNGTLFDPIFPPNDIFGYEIENP